MQKEFDAFQEKVDELTLNSKLLAGRNVILEVEIKESKKLLETKNTALSEATVELCVLKKRVLEMQDKIEGLESDLEEVVEELHENIIDKTAAQTELNVLKKSARIKNRSRRKQSSLRKAAM